MNKKTLRQSSNIPGGKGLQNTNPPLKYYGSEFVLNSETGLFYRVTPVAILLLKAMVDGADNEALVDVVQRHCAISRSTAIRDVELLINELSVRGILNSWFPKRV